MPGGTALKRTSIQAANATPFRRIAIVGTGLMGGSWGLALKAAGFRGVRIGIDCRSTLERALQRGAIDESHENLEAAVHGTDLIVLAAPVGRISLLIPWFARQAQPTALVTDVGSVKFEICRRAKESFDSGALFLGGHPLAGKETSGIDSAEATLFAKATYALTPLRSEDMEDPRAKAFCELIRRFGAQPHVTTAEIHDEVVAYTSHLPQLLSTGLTSLLDERGEADCIESSKLAGPGLLDFTRLADSAYSLWRDILLTNRGNIQNALDAYIQKLEDMKLRLSERALEQDFKRGAHFRNRLKKR
ncbi:MAG: prephenate dehydrogenase [Terriglobia bacterium]